MTDRPILFSAPMIRALLDGRKTQTRRVLNPQPDTLENGFAGVKLRIAVGDRLWVREAHYLTDDGDNEYALFPADEGAEIAAHLEQITRLEREYPPAERWSKHKRIRPSIHMPRWASRLTLTVTDVRVQRLQDITEADAMAEGARAFIDGAGEPWHDYGAGTPAASGEPQYAFRLLWDSINGPDAWAANPWVAAYTFTVQHGNIDQIGGAA